MKNKYKILILCSIMAISLFFMGFINKKEAQKKSSPNYNFVLEDQYGKKHTLSDYKGKVIFLNFWASWCPSCNEEMPDIVELYKEYGQNKQEVIILTVANPSTKEFPRNTDVKIEKLKKIIQKKQYSVPVLMDTTGEVFDTYRIRALPTTYVISKDGEIQGPVMGALPKKAMKEIIEKFKQNNKN